MSQPMKDYLEILNSNAGVQVLLGKVSSKRAYAELHVDLPELSAIAGKDCSTVIHYDVPVAKQGEERTQHELLKKGWFQLQKYLRHISKEIFGMAPSTIGIDLRPNIVKKDAYDLPNGRGYTGPLCSVHFVVPVSKLKRKNMRNLCSGQATNLIDAYNMCWARLAETIKM
ncbi:MAG: hypothetical protein NC548_06145 [Lachnospiraceae bacterium]|nr:hypothetical protein [Lachnospiraceae bacterium]